MTTKSVCLKPFPVFFSTTIAFYFLMCCSASSVTKQTITLGVILPHSNFVFRMRAYQRYLNASLDTLTKSKNPSFNFTNYMSVETEVIFMKINPTPTEVLTALCRTFLSRNVTAVLYLAHIEMFVTSTASTLYFHQLANYLGIPIISWNAVNSGLERKVSEGIMIQMSPSVRHQCAAMLSVLQRYSWHQFAIVTSYLAGHTEFVSAVRDEIELLRNVFRLTLLSIVKVDSNSGEVLQQTLAQLQNTDTRVILLYASKEDAIEIFKAAHRLGLIGKSYMWIVSRAILGEKGETGEFPVTPDAFPVGMLGIYFSTKDDIIEAEVDKAIKVFGHGLELFVNDPRNGNQSLQPNLSCNDTVAARWTKGHSFARYLRNVSISLGAGKPNIEFTADGMLKYAELEVYNLNAHLKWQKFGTWTPNGLDVKDIVWPGNSLVPPQGMPEKFHLRIAFLEEKPFINLDKPDMLTAKCINRGVACHAAALYVEDNGKGNASAESPKTFCCSGFSIDLLVKFAADLGFTYELFRVEDGYWGSEMSGQWNGLVAALLQHKADIVISSFQMNSMRELVIDFSFPFLETGIGIVVSKRTGIISPKAFLEPFDTVSWIMILLVSIHVAAFAIFFFEWISPSGYNMTLQPPTDYRFSLLRTYWMVWADLFGASVNVDCPRSFSARFMSSVWAMFAVVFLAIYTANLAAFMITREEYYDLTGIEDTRLSNPYAYKPPFRFGTVPYSSTDAVLQIHHPLMHSYMKQFNHTSLADGINAVKKGELDAFVYDATVLQYVVGQDDKCNLLTVGAWYAMTGYGIGFPRDSKYLAKFNKFMIIYKENGDLDRLRRYWMTGGCQPEKRERRPSKPLSFDQFMSAFLLLSLGILFAIVLFLMEYVYCNYFRKHLRKSSTSSCFALVSLSMGKSLLSRNDTVYMKQRRRLNHRCHDEICKAHLLKVYHELSVARLRIRQLEKVIEGTTSIYRVNRTPSPSIYDQYNMSVNYVTTKQQQQQQQFRGAQLSKREETHVAEIITVL